MAALDAARQRFRRCMSSHRLPDSPGEDTHTNTDCQNTISQTRSAGRVRHIRCLDVIQGDKGDGIPRIVDPDEQKEQRGAGDDE